MRRDDFSENKIATIVKFIELVLTTNNLKFQGSHYIQMTGTAMGTKMAPTYANLYLGGLETDLQDKALYKPLLWCRFIDDIFFLWTHGRAKLEQFYQQCNLFDPNIKFEQTISDKSIPFLDVLVILKDGKIETDLYSKPTDTHQYLNWTSCHPRHTKASIPYSQALRLRRICSKKEYFENRARDLHKILLERGYKNKLIKESIMSARRITREEALTAKTTNRVTNRVPLVVTYNPGVQNLRKIVNQYHPLLHTSSRCKEIFSSPPLTAYRRGHNLTQILTSKRLRSSSPDTPSATPIAYTACLYNH